MLIHPILAFASGLGATLLAIRTKHEQLGFIDTLLNRLTDPHKVREIYCPGGDSAFSSDLLSTQVMTMDVHGAGGDGVLVPNSKNAVSFHSIRSLMSFEPYKAWIPRLQMWSAACEESLDTKIIVEGRFKVSTDCSASVLCLMGYNTESTEGERYTILTSVSAILTIPGGPKPSS